MKRRIFFLSFCLFCSLGNLFPQQAPPSKKVAKLRQDAVVAMNNQQFDKANEYLQKIFQIDPNYADAHILQGDVYNLMMMHEKAAESYSTAIRILKTPKPILYFILAGEELKSGQYERALQNFNTYIELAGTSIPPAILDELDEGITTCQFAIQAIQQPVSFNPINLGPNINSEWDEYLAALTADEEEFIFTVRRPRDTKTICTFCKTEEDFYSSIKVNGEWQPRKALESPINSSYNEGAQAISPDGKYLFYTLCETDFGYGSCDLYWARKIGNRWSRPRNFGEAVNSKYWESQPTVGPDGKTIYFASNRPGGYGGVDIWKTEMIEEGVFTIPVNLGPVINTKKDDTAPFIHADGKTLYFASNGRPGMGGRDLYYAILQDDDSWSEPTNLGYPINTIADEINIIVNAAGTTAYFASDKEGGYGGLDLYYFDLDERLRPTPVTYVKGVVQDAQTRKPLEASVELIDLHDNKVITSTTSDPQTGEFLACILTGTNVLLNVNHPNYPFYSENFQIAKSYSNLDPFFKDILLHKAEIGSSFILRNIFFDFDKSTLSSESFVELDLLVDYLNKNASLKIEIGGHTDNQGSDAYNNTLSLERAKSVYNYLLSKGIDTGRLSYKGYGKTKPIATNDTEEGRAINRRTEFTITGR